MNHAERCPVCGGRGKLPAKLGEDVGGTGELVRFVALCHGCDGKGWVVVPDDGVVEMKNEKTKTNEFPR